MFQAPMPIGPFLVEEDGQLRLRLPGREPAFTFRWRSRAFTVLISAGKLSLSAQAGRIPSSADGPGERERALTLLRAAPPCLPKQVRLRLLPDYRLQLDMESRQDWPSTVSALITPIVGMLMRMAPVLDLLEEGGLVAK